MGDLFSAVAFMVVVALILVLAIPALLLWLGITIVRDVSGPHTHAGRDPSVEQLRYRYARGEITLEQFEQEMRDLGYEKVR